MQAQLLLGTLYEDGLGVQPSRQEARELYRRACDGRNQDGCVELKRLDGREGSGGGVGWKRDRSLGAIAGRVAGKTLFIALLLLLGIPLILAGRLALRKLLKMPDADTDPSPKRACGMPRMKGAEAGGGNTSGVGEEKQKPAGAGRPETASEGRDLDDAKDFRFEPVPEKNPADADGLYRLGCMATDGAGDAPEAEARAMEFFRKAAAKGYAKAQTRLGCMLLAQWRCAEARAWFWKAAEQGVPQAQAELGFLLLYGSGGDRNDSMAARALSWDAAQGEPRAMSVLSLMAEHGLGMPENEAEAERWQEGARAAGGRTAMDAFRKETEGMLRNWGVIGLEPRKRFKRFLSTLDTPARRIGFLALLLGIALAISGLAGIATDIRHPGTGSIQLLSGGNVLAGAGALGMTGMLDRLWSWILHGSKRR